MRSQGPIATILPALGLAVLSVAGVLGMALRPPESGRVLAWLPGPDPLAVAFWAGLTVLRPAAPGAVLLHLEPGDRERLRLAGAYLAINAAAAAGCWGRRDR